MVALLLLLSTPLVHPSSVAASPAATDRKEITSAEVRIPGMEPWQLYTNPADSTIRVVLEKTAIWEDLETRWVLNTVRPGDVFIDAGANIGYYTVLASKLVGDEGRVIAFEPDPVSYAILERNVRENRLRNVQLEQKALSNEPGSLRLYLAHRNMGDHRLFDQTDAPRDFVDVEAVRMDDYLGDRKNDVDFIKVDTQGAEGIILEGMVETIRANPKVVMVMEYTPTSLRSIGTDPAAFLDLLSELDFRFFNLGMGFGDIPLKPIRRSYLSRNSDYPHNLLMLSGLGNLRELDAKVDAARQRLRARASANEAGLNAWTEETRRNLETNPWKPVTQLTVKAEAPVQADAKPEGCVRVHNRGAKGGDWTTSFETHAATALRVLSRTVNADSGLSSQRITAAQFNSNAVSDPSLEFFAPREHERPMPAHRVNLRAQANIAGIVQTPLPTTPASETARIDLKFSDITGPAADVCFLTTDARRPMDSDLEIALKLPEARRSRALQDRVVDAYAERAKEFAGEREALTNAIAARDAFQTLSAEKIQAWIRP